jgi:hypothetical protein
MANRNNPKRGETRRTEHGPHWKGENPERECDAPSVARARSKRKREAARKERRTGKSSQFWGGRPRTGNE